MSTPIRTSLLLLTLLLLLAGATRVAAASTNHTAGLTATIHGAAQLQMSSCLYPDDNNALFLAFIDNPSADKAATFSVTLHTEAGELLAERTFSTLLPGESKTFAVRVAAQHYQASAVDARGACSGPQ